MLSAAAVVSSTSTAMRGSPCPEAYFHGIMKAAAMAEPVKAQAMPRRVLAASADMGAEASALTGWLWSICGVEVGSGARRTTKEG